MIITLSSVFYVAEFLLQAVKIGGHTSRNEVSVLFSGNSADSITLASVPSVLRSSFYWSDFLSVNPFWFGSHFLKKIFFFSFYEFYVCFTIRKMITKHFFSTWSCAFERLVESACLNWLNLTRVRVYPLVPDKKKKTFLGRICSWFVIRTRMYIDQRLKIGPWSFLTPDSCELWMLYRSDN